MSKWQLIVKTVTVFYRYKSLSGYWMTTNTIFQYEGDFNTEFSKLMKKKKYTEWEVTNIL